MKKNLYPFVLIGISIILVYGRMLDNFFYYDDFPWLDNVRNLEQKPLSIFDPIVHPQADSLTSLPVSYITPAVYILYWINYKAFGLNPFGYHLFNLILHILNSYLVVYFVFLLRCNLPSATLIGLLFALSFAITDAVIWSGAYVDTLMFFFYILSLIVFLSFIAKGNNYKYLLSIILFILSLSVKGTALTLPLALFIVERHYASSKTSLKRLLKYIPFIIIALSYLFLLHYKSISGDLMSSYVNIERIILNVFKVPMTLFLPEGLLPIGFWWVLLCILIFSIFALGEIKKDTSGICRLGILLMLAGVLPLLLINWEFPTDPDPLTLSIRHRLYLGNLGSAIFLGGIFYSHYNASYKLRAKAIVGLLLISFIGLNVYWNNAIQTKWDKVTGDTQNALNEFKKIASKYKPASAIYFINFPPNQGFSAFFFKLYLEHLKLNIGVWPREIPPHPDTIKIDYYLQLNGHLYNNPDAAADIALTPREHFFVGQLYLLMGDKIKGVAELEKATAFESEEKLHLAAADTYEKLGLYLKAMAELKKVISINKNSIKGYEALGGIAFRTGDYDSAIKWYEKVIYLNKKDSTTMGKLAELYEHKGKNYKAREMWEMALKYENRKEFREMIKKNLSQRPM